MGFHAPQETARILAEAIDYARQGQLAATALATGAHTSDAEVIAPITPRLTASASRVARDLAVPHA